jgi:hypothetical protein
MKDYAVSSALKRARQQGETMDELQMQVVEQLPADGSAITFDAWKAAVAANVGAGAVMRTANKYNRGMVQYTLQPDGSGGVVLMVARIIGAVG